MNVKYPGKILLSLLIAMLAWPHCAEAKNKDRGRKHSAVRHADKAHAKPKKTEKRKTKASPEALPKEDKEDREDESDDTPYADEVPAKPQKEGKPEKRETKTEANPKALPKKDKATKEAESDSNPLLPDFEQDAAELRQWLQQREDERIRNGEVMDEVDASFEAESQFSKGSKRKLDLSLPGEGGRQRHVLDQLDQLGRRSPDGRHHIVLDPLQMDLHDLAPYSGSRSGKRSAAPKAAPAKKAEHKSSAPKKESARPADDKARKSKKPLDLRAPL